MSSADRTAFFRFVSAFVSHVRSAEIYLFICSNMVQHEQLLKQLHEQDNKADINSTDRCSI